MHAHTRAKSNLNSAPRRLSPRPIYGPSRSAAVTLIAAFYFTLYKSQEPCNSRSAYCEYCLSTPRSIWLVPMVEAVIQP
uniref:Secreted protein n=1 Tax=Panagrellus redivivus TaxID=6233 RepID=A0A7E4USG3_PANRE